MHADPTTRGWPWLRPRRRSSGSTSSSRAASASSTRDHRRKRSGPRFASASSAVGWSATSARPHSAGTRSSPASTSTRELLDRWPTGSAASACRSLDELLAHELDVVIVAVPHDQLAEHACRALDASAHVLVEKPAGIGVADVGRIARAAEAARRRVKVGFNHRFHPGTARAIAEARSERFGPILHMRARYGHGGRVGYEHEWRARRAVSGGGELVDQGMHLFDLSYSLFGPLPLNSRAPAHRVLADRGRGQRRDRPRPASTAARGRCSTRAGRSGRTSSRSRSSADRRSCRWTASRGRTDLSDSPSTR